MKQRRISALVMVMVLLLSNFCFAAAFAEGAGESQGGLVGAIENNQAPASTALIEGTPTQQPVIVTQPPVQEPAPTPEVTAIPEMAATPEVTAIPEAAATPEVTAIPEVTPMPEAAATPEATAPAREKINVLIFDCGYALYGEKDFEKSIVKEPGDPEGRIMKFVQSNLALLLGENAKVAVYGYHSDLVKTGEAPVLVSDSEAVAAQFNKLFELSAKQRQSSKTDAALMDMMNDLKKLMENYDIELYIFSGGAINYYSGKPDADGFAKYLDAMRQEGVKLNAYGFDLVGAGMANAEEQANVLMETYFLEDEYHAAQIPVTENGADYAAARLNMMDSILADLLADQALVPERIADPATTDYTYTDSVLVWGVDQVNGPVAAQYGVEDYKAFAADPGRTASMSEMAAWTIMQEGADEVPQLTQEEIDAINRDKAQVQSLGECLSAIRTDLEQNALDVFSGAKVSGLTPDYDHTLFTFTSDNKEVLTAEVVDKQLIITPLKAGSATVACHYSDPETKEVKSIEVLVNVVDSRMEMVKDEAQNSVSLTSYDGVLNWTVTANRGTAGTQTVSCSTANFAPSTIEGVNWTLSEDGSTVTVTANAVGDYTIDFNLTDANGNVMREGSRLTHPIIISRPLDAVTSPVELITPYFKEQPGQLVNLTSMGAPVDLDEYVVTVMPNDVANVYYGREASSLYITPVRKGLVDITIGEKYINSEPITFQVHVESLMSNPMIWVCGAGAVLCLILLTTGVVILIGKGASKRRVG